MKKIILIFVLFFSAYSIAESTNGYRNIERIYLNGTDYTHFFLDEDCPEAKKYYSLFSTRVNVERYYSLVLSAYMANKKISVNYEKSGTFCEVTSITVID